MTLLKDDMAECLLCAGVHKNHREAKITVEGGIGITVKAQ